MKNKVFLFIISTFFIFFVVLLLAQSEGYYQNKNEKAKALTDEQIKEFEQDVSNGKSIDIRKYVLYEEKDYSNNVSKDIYKISLKLENVVDKTLKLIFNNAASVIED